MAAKEWYEWWLSEDDHGDTIEDVSKATWDAATKAAEAKFTSTNNERDEIIRLLDGVSAEERIEIFHNYCVHCGGNDPRCQCWNDE